MNRGFRVRQTLIKEKKGVLKRDYQSKAMEEGHQLEPEARALYIKTTRNNVTPACIQSSRYDWLIASLDGISEDYSTVVEIKCGAHTYKTIQESGEISRSYYSQVQHILAVTGLSSVDFWCYRPNKEGLLLPIERDDEYIEELLEAELALWDEIQSATNTNIHEIPTSTSTAVPTPRATKAPPKTNDHDLRLLRSDYSSIPSSRPNEKIGNAYEPWTTEDDLKLKYYYEKELTIKELQVKFNRSDGAIRSRLKRIGIYGHR